MENVFELAGHCLQAPSVEEKIRLARQLFALCRDNQLSFESVDHVLPVAEANFPENPMLLPPKAMPQRKLNTRQGQAAFFHALAHIEFIAISLAMDIVYRFRDLPPQFYLDWLKVADEEAQHFMLLQLHLQEFQLSYGDLPAHAGLWSHAEETADDLLGRLAIVPRCLEARGLDVTPAIIEKFRSMNDAQAVQLLTRILEDEIGHVQLGSKWFRFFCDRQELDPETTYRDKIRHFFRGMPRGPFNREMRIIAGFTNEEIDWLERGQHE